MFECGENIDQDESFYCGNEAGRKNDSTDDDLKFSTNLELMFYTPEMLFLDQPVNFPLIKDVILDERYTKDFEKWVKKNTETVSKEEQNKDKSDEHAVKWFKTLP